jgi:hypothetical protein
MEDGAVTFELTWSAFSDACEKCRFLEGTKWTLNDITGSLTHPEFGDVYDLDADISLTHPNCRCWLQVDVNIDLEKSLLIASLKNTIYDWSHHMPSNLAEAKEQVRELDSQIQLTYTQFRMFERILIRTLHLARRAGLSEDMTRGIEVMTRAIWVARMLTISLHALMIAEGPLGWANALLGITTAGVMWGDTMYDAQRGS